MSREKKPPLSEIDLARAASTVGTKRRGIIVAGTKEGGYPYYRGTSSAYPIILNVASLAPTDDLSVDEINGIVEHACGSRKGEIDANKHLAHGLRNYVQAHHVKSALFEHEPAGLGRAGKRHFWVPFILEIDGKRHFAFIDPRLECGGRRLDFESRRFVFSVMHSHLREQNPNKYGGYGLVIFQFGEPKKGAREAEVHFADKIRFWSADEIAKMIDAVYRILDQINAGKKAA